MNSTGMAVRISARATATKTKHENNNTYSYPLLINTTVFAGLPASNSIHIQYHTSTCKVNLIIFHF